MNEKRLYESLKHNTDDLKRISSAYIDGFIGLGNYPLNKHTYLHRRQDISACLGILCVHHLEYPMQAEPLDYLKKGFDIAVDYFCGDWWKGNEEDRYYLDRSFEEWEPNWNKQFANGLLLGLLSERWEELDQVCNWVEASLVPGYIGDTKADYEMVKIHLSVAASLRKKPMPGLEEMEQDILDSKQRGPIQLFEAWTAARNNDQAGFEKGLIAALKRTGSRRGRKPTVFDWVGINESIVALAAQRLGMTIPDLPPKLNALLITPESIGVK